MKEDDSRLFGQHVAVDRRDVDAVGTQCAYHVRDFRAYEGEVAGDRCLAAAGRLEVDGGYRISVAMAEKTFKIGPVLESIGGSLSK